MGHKRLPGTEFSTKHSSAGRPWGFNHIKGADNGKETIYMTRAWIGRLRFHLFRRGDEDPDCHDHPWAFWTFPLRSYVEEVLHEQRDTITAHSAVDGATFEHALPTRYFTSLEVVRAFRWHYRPATYRHRVIGPLAGEDMTGPKVKPGWIPTIVWRGDFERKWGFTKRDPLTKRWCFVPWQTYVYEGGNTAPCQDIELEKNQ